MCTVQGWVQKLYVHIENCEGWLSPGGHSSGGRALPAKVRGPRFNPGWLPVFHSSLKIFPSLSPCTLHITYMSIYMEVQCISGNMGMTVHLLSFLSGVCIHVVYMYMYIL